MNTKQMIDLAFTAAFYNLGSHKTMDSIRMYIEYIEKEYSNPSRYYHTMKHITNMTEMISDLYINYKDDILKYGILPEELILATLFHDIVYDTKPASMNDSVKLSSTYARCVMEVLGIPELSIKVICELVNITDLHVIDETNIYINPFVQGIFIDADNAILGSSPEDYLEYRTNIYAEYSHYGKEMYTIGRTKFLNGMISKEKIFNTDYMNKKYGDRARMNMIDELVYLSTWE